MSGKTILVWFRNDLRIHDNEILLEATKKADTVLPVYCFDPNHFGLTQAGTLKTGVIRSQFIIDSVRDLRESLRKLGGELIVRLGKPEEVIPMLVQQYGVAEVYHHREVAFEETETSARVEAALWKLRINLKHFIGHTMYHKEDLPFPIKDIPDVFATFRKKIERESVVRPCLPSPDSVNVPDVLEAGEIPGLAELGFEERSAETVIESEFKGGESEGLKKLSAYLEDNSLSKDQKDRAAAVFISRLSPWISLGCLSTRKVYWEIRSHEQQFSRDAVNWQMLELLRRDYFRFMFKKHNNKFSSVRDVGECSADQEQFFEAWKNAKTGIAYVDAIMSELNATGYISNPGRQAAAQYFIKGLEHNWPLGAAYFEEKLVDYSPASNWGNWSSLVETAVKISDMEDYLKRQAAIHDPAGSYTSRWNSSLTRVSGELTH